MTPGECNSPGVEAKTGDDGSLLKDRTEIVGILQLSDKRCAPTDKDEYISSRDDIHSLSYI